LAEQLAASEAARVFLYGLVLDLRSGRVKPEQVEELAGGGFKLNALPEQEDATQASADSQPPDNPGGE